MNTSNPITPVEAITAWAAEVTTDTWFTDEFKAQLVAFAELAKAVAYWKEVPCVERELQMCESLAKLNEVLQK